MDCNLKLCYSNNQESTEPPNLDEVNSQRNRNTSNINTSTSTVEDEVNCIQWRPVDEAWQKEKCQEFGLTFKRCVTYTSSSSQNLVPAERCPRIKADGNCFFRSICFVISGSQEDHKLLHTLIVSHMEENDATLKHMYDKYLQNSIVHEDSTWATDAELFGVSSFLKINIYLYHSGYKHWQTYTLGNGYCNGYN